MRKRYFAVWNPGLFSLTTIASLFLSAGTAQSLGLISTAPPHESAALVASRRSAQSSGPEAPRVLLDFPYPERTGRVLRVEKGDNLQSVLNRARRGDEIVLAAGATFTGTFTLPAKSGSLANGWIVMRGEDSAGLPPIGTRVSPAHSSSMPKIVTPGVGPALATARGANGWRLVGLEVTMSPAVREQNYGLVFLGDALQSDLASVPADLVLDRMYIHGQTSSSLSRCVALNSARTQISDSYLSECHGKGFDSQAIAGWNGPGPFKIVNNMLMGAGENLMFGGGDPRIPGLVPSDIEIRRNYFYTPVSWRGVWTKKNLFELKNAVRVLVEGNVFDGSWGDGQDGFAILFTSANQDGGCRWCRTTDVMFRRNLIRNTSAGINFIAPPWRNVDTLPRRIVVSETVLEVGAFAPHRGFQIQDGVVVQIERTVVSGAANAIIQTGDAQTASATCTFRDNVWIGGQYGVAASGGYFGKAALDRLCRPGYTWSGMTLVTPSAAAGYPPRTTFVTSESRASLAAQIRSIVQQATAGVVVSP